MLICKFCKKDCKNDNSLRNHERLCPSNKDRNYISYTLGKKGHVAWNKGLDINDSRVKKQADLTRGQRRKMSEQGRANIKKGCINNGGYRENAGRSKKFKVFDSFGDITTLQSTYEYAVFEILSELEIRWVRPKALKYDNRNYFADFYLIDFNVYLDPKNDYKARQDEYKIKTVTEQNNIRLYVLLKEHINKQTIASLI